MGTGAKGWRLKSMCNDYERHLDWTAFCKALEDAKLGLPADAQPSQLPASDDTRVYDLAPVIRSAGNGIELATLKWGFRPRRPRGPPVFNFRSESRSFAKSKRCLIPASAFFEFTGRGAPKSKWRFELVNSPVLAVAGLWRDEAEGEYPAFTMLTVAPGPDVAPFHDRQIAVIPAIDWGAWLYLERPENELLKPLPAQSLRVTLARSGSDKAENDLIIAATSQ